VYTDRKNVVGESQTARIAAIAIQMKKDKILENNYYFEGITIDFEYKYTNL